MSWQPPVPEGWVATPLGEVADVVGGATPDTKDATLWGEDVAWVTPADLAKHEGKYIEHGARGLSHKGLASCAAQLLPAGTVLYSSRAPIGHIAVATKPVATNQGCKSAVPAAGVDPSYLYWYLVWATPEIQKLGSGTTFAEISGKVMKTVPLLLPPFEEQQRLVLVLEEHLSRLDGVVRALTGVQASLRAAHQRTLTAAVRGELGGAQRSDGGDTGHRLVEHRCRERGTRSSVQNGPWTLPSTWAWALIGDLFDVFVGATPSRANPDLWGGGVPWVSSGEVAFNRIAHTRETISSAAVGNPEKRLHPPGTVMLAMIGEGKTRGQAAILDVEAAHNQNCASIRVPGSGVLPEWVFWCLAERYDRTRSEGAGNNQPALNKARVQEIELPIPPAEVQRDLVAWIERQSGTIAATSTAFDGLLARCAVLRRSLLQAAFTGRLGTRDPADEPADLVLKRIAEERAGVASTPHGRRARNASIARAGAGAMPVQESA
jgi:type I restriction enzyme S subunit